MCDPKAETQENVQKGKRVSFEQGRELCHPVAAHKEQEAKVQQTFHLRRMQTKYLCGFSDMDEQVVSMIKENNSLTKQQHDRVQEFSRELAEHKAFVKELTSKRDVVF